MKIQLLSDLHFEFHPDAGRAFVADLDPYQERLAVVHPVDDLDVLVVAGDLAVASDLVRSLSRLCRRYLHTKVVYVSGNHDFYGSDRECVLDDMKTASTLNPNLAWLDCSLVEIGGVRFLGAPLWFPAYEGDPARKSLLTDFSAIEDFELWVYEENARAVAFFERELLPGDVVVTHHLPSQLCVAPQYQGSPLDPFFVCDMTRLIVERRPRLWLHGHTHSSVNVRIADTTVLCNPLGYWGREQNQDFSKRLIVEI